MGFKTVGETVFTCSLFILPSNSAKRKMIKILTK